MPQEMDSSKPRAEEAKRILSQTVDLFESCFGDTSLERWRQAEKIALTMAGCAGISTTVVSTNLMGEALRQAEKAYLEDALSRHEQEKKQPIEPATDSRQTKIIWAWTKQMLRAKVPIMPYQPRETEITSCGMALGLSARESDRCRTLMKIVLASERVCAACKRGDIKTCPFGGHYALTKKEGRLHFYQEACHEKA